MYNLLTFQSLVLLIIISVIFTFILRQIIPRNSELKEAIDAHMIIASIIMSIICYFLTQSIYVVYYNL